MSVRPFIIIAASGLLAGSLTTSSCSSSPTSAATGGATDTESGGRGTGGAPGAGGTGNPSGGSPSGGARPGSGGNTPSGGSSNGGAPSGGSPSGGSPSGGGAGTGATGGTEVTSPAPADPVAALGNCLAPAGALWTDAVAAYAQWTRDLVTRDGARGFRRVKRPNSANAINTSNSEGIAYGMLLAVAMNDQALFDDLWRYALLFPDDHGLMHWEINPEGTGTTANGQNGATDGDEDMAFALLWADTRWGGKGALADAYKSYALKQIDLIWKYEVDHAMGDALMAGDHFGGAAVINISYFAPAYFRAFGKVTGKTADWNKVVESSYTILAATLNATNKNASNGLVPAWSTPAGVPMAPSGTSMPINHQLDSCRTPFRIGQDYCWYGEPRAKAYLAKISGFYQQVGADKIANGYNLDGTASPTNPTVNQSAAFVGPAAVGAMSDPAFATLRDQGYRGVATLKQLDGSLYYTESWTGLSLVLMNGGYWNPK